MRVFNIFKNFFGKNKVIHLGRWEHRVDNKQKYIRATRSNMDHCGDVSCGFPQNHTKKNIDKISKSKD